MAENYDKTLELFKKLQEGGATDAIATPAKQASRPNILTGDISQLNEAVFGKYNAESDTSTSDGQKILMETMKEFESGNVSEETRRRVEENVRNSKIPKAILDSVLSKPLIETKIEGSDVDEYMENLMKKNTNIQASNRIIQKLNESDGQRIETPSRETVRSEFNYDKLEEIVESIMDRKLNQFIGKINLNESRSETPQLKMIQEVSGSKFLLADTSDNVYECTLKYIGKNKKKK
jgi:hypothetical protein